jgi:hypothetical protein
MVTRIPAGSTSIKSVAEIEPFRLEVTSIVGTVCVVKPDEGGGV